jgi:tRNA A37 N6-isopentenylltransferase MiaA
MLPSHSKPDYNPPLPSLLVYLDRDRADLYNRINQRTEIMLNSGWTEEVAALQGTDWPAFIGEKHIIGYNDILDYLAQSHENKIKLAERIAQHTRNYAKRQGCFWRMLKRLIADAQQAQPAKHNCFVRELNLTLHHAKVVLCLLRSVLVFFLSL